LIREDSLSVQLNVPWDLEYVTVDSVEGKKQIKMREEKNEVRTIRG